MYTIIHESPRRLGNQRVVMSRQFIELRDSAPKLRKNIFCLCLRLTSGRTKREAYPAPKVIWLIPQGSEMQTHHDHIVGQSCVVGPGRPRYERSDNCNPEYSSSGTSSTSPVSPPPTVFDINDTLSIAGGSVCRCPQAPPLPSPLRSPCQVTVRPLSPGPRWGLPQKSDLPPMATTPSPTPHTESLCCGTVPYNSCPRRSLLHSFLPPRNGFVVVPVIVVSVFINIVVVVVLGLGRPPHGPLPPCYPRNGENTKAWVWVADDESDPNDRSHSWLMR